MRQKMHDAMWYGRGRGFVWVGVLVLLLCLWGVAVGGGASAAEVSADTEPRRATVYIADVDGVIGVPLEEHFERIFSEAKGADNPVLILRINTPGGLVDSMSRLMEMMADADYPVVAWVGPSGARAASAGAFLVQAAHVAAMAPGTNVGAAHPVLAGGKDIEGGEMSRKVLNDLTAKMRAFAQERGRNVEVAEKMVSESLSLTAREAVEKKVVDFIAEDEEDLLQRLAGRKVKIKGRERAIDVDSYEIRRVGMTPRLRLLEIISRPDIAYLALIAGIFLIILEAKAPGGFAMGALGGLLLLVASYGLRVLPVNFAGVALLVAGIVVIVLDLLLGAGGLLAAVGVGGMLFGGLILYKAPGAELLHISSGFIVGTTATIGMVFLVMLRLIYKALRRKPASGAEGMVGERGRVTGRTDRYTMVFARGEYWRALPVDGNLSLEVGEEVEVVRMESLVLYVKPVDLPSGRPHSQ